MPSAATLRLSALLSAYIDISKLLKSFGARPLTMFVPLSHLRFFAGLRLPEPSPVIFLSAEGAAFS